MEISKYGLEFIKKEEGFITEAYWDYKQYSIGYGSGQYIDGTSVKKGDVVTREKASEMLESHIARIIYPIIKKCVKISLTQNQFDALCSFIYNLGNGAFEKSTLLKLLNQNKIVEASLEFDKWVNAGGEKLLSLVRRRRKEKELFMKKG